MRWLILLSVIFSSTTLASPSLLAVSAQSKTPQAMNASSKVVTTVKTHTQATKPTAKAIKRKPKLLSMGDERIHAVRYVPEGIVLLQGRLGYQTQIVFSDEESVQNVSIGDSLAWQAVPVNNRLFIKPVAASNTNMTILTNLRSYNFELQVGDVTPTYELKFLYPELQVVSNKPLQPTRYNIRYSYSGDPSQAPLELFDDGQFTYFKFPKGGLHALPAIFRVEKNRQLTLLDYHIQGDYVVVNRVAKQFLLQNGEHQTCIFNDDAIGDADRIRG
jgi:type IV secretion system protein VirB9